MQYQNKRRIRGGQKVRGWPNRVAKCHRRKTRVRIEQELSSQTIRQQQIQRQNRKRFVKYGVVVQPDLAVNKGRVPG